MHSLAFPYKLRGFELLPIVPVTLYGPDANTYAEAYVDSGAFYSIFDLSITRLIGIDLIYARTKMFIVGNGDFIPAKIVKIPVAIGEHKFISDIAFSDKLKIGFNLLGRKGIFEYFDEVAFSEKKKSISFRLRR